MTDPSPTSPTHGWTVLAERNGVTLRTTGEGSPVFVFSGLEGSGESCLHLVEPVLSGAASEAAAEAGSKNPVRPVLVDYALEQHATFTDLVATTASLVDEVYDGGAFDLWMQSFGNILGTCTLARSRIDAPAMRAVMVSPFRKLPAWKVVLGPPVLKVTPDALYRATAAPISGWQFGPDGGNKGHMFYDALGRLTKGDLARRAGWLRGADFGEDFRQLRATRVKAWLGALDRLENVKEEIAFFASLSDQPGREVGVFGESGHVVLPPPAIDDARRRISAWFWEGS